jgi:hypothetical protein
MYIFSTLCLSRAFELLTRFQIRGYVVSKIDYKTRNATRKVRGMSESWAAMPRRTDATDLKKKNNIYLEGFLSSLPLGVPVL